MVNSDFMCLVQALDGARMDIEMLGNHRDGLSLEKFKRSLLLGERKRASTTKRFPACACGFHSCLGAFADQRAFKLGECSHHMK
ncbi:hypothetical protein WJ39_29715 [Burkholderia diffusa]|nr:hypothetical protein WJ39_29715 [Burkholderia diffusa]